MARDLLLEIGTEDLPARYVVPLRDALGGLVGKLQQRGVSVSGMETYATPRRIAVLAREVDERQPDQTQERLGPALSAALKDGQPTPAGLGFAKSCGVDFAALGQRDGKLHYIKALPGRETVSLLPEVFEETLKQMDELVPKRMRWGDGNETFVRPVQWLTCLFGAEVVPLQRFGLIAGRRTYGHRFHAPEAIELESPAGYVERLRAAQVWADVASRKAEVRRQIEAEAQRLGGHARVTEDLLDEVSTLVEWPTAIVGHFEARFLRLPPEVIVATVETNQRYFTVFEDRAHTRLTPAFITISNIQSRDPAQVVAGNERVVRPRLSDALFFWEQDLKQPLLAFAEKLETVTFQKELGSIGAKAHRIEALARRIAESLQLESAPVARAAALAKCDLVTRMVYEFPELQGVMGGYYAKESGEPAEVAQAVREHYLPTQQGTPIPATQMGQIIALADKLDTLAGIFAVGQKPTASKDPFALRRAALGVLRICLEAQLPLDLADLLKSALGAQPAGKRDGAMLQELLDFFTERLRAYLVGQSLDGRPVTAEMFEAVDAMGVTQPLDFLHRLQAVHAFVAHPAAPNLAAANKRVRNILRQAGGSQGAIDPGRFEHEVERRLFAMLGELETRNADADYTARLVNLASLREPVDAFFEAVMVNAEDAAVRSNRLALLTQLDQLCRSVADLSCLPG